MKRDWPKPSIESTMMTQGKSRFHFLCRHAIVLSFFFVSQRLFDLNIRYITKDNLRYLFGNEFPEDELDSIMSESASDDGKGISYADFLSQWNDNKEEYMKRWRDHMVPDEVTEKDDNDTQFYERTDMVSELSFDGSCGPDDHGRSDFVRAKAVSERKRRDANNVPTETK